MHNLTALLWECSKESRVLHDRGSASSVRVRVKKNAFLNDGRSF